MLSTTIKILSSDNRATLVMSYYKNTFTNIVSCISGVSSITAIIDQFLQLSDFNLANARNVQQKTA